MAKKSRKVFATTATAALVASAVAPIASSAAGFSDVTKPEYKTAIDALAEAGILNGYENGTFKPENKVTRGEVAKVITLIRHLEEGTKTPFKDVKDGYWSTQYINSLYAAKLVNGYEDGTFKPEGNVTRAEFAKLVVDAYGLTLTNAATPFTDVKAGNWATPYIQTAYANGLIKGVTASKFDPSAPIKRGDLAILLHRADSKFGDVIGNNFPGVELVKATNNTTVEVTFKNEVDAKNVKAANFSIEGLTVSNAAVKQTDSKTVVLTTSAQEGGKQYTVKSGAATLGKFIGASAVVPSDITVNTKSLQGVIGEEVTLSAQVKVKEGESAAGIPVTFNIQNDSKDNKTIEVEALTNDKGVAEYSYTRYYNGVDNAVAYATKKSTVKDNAKVYWASAKQLTVKDITEATSLTNGSKKVYEINSVKNANKYVFVTFEENLNVTPDKVTKGVSAQGVETLVLNSNGDVSSTTAVYPYELSTGGKAVIAVKLDANGKANLVLSGSDASVTPIVFEGTHDGGTTYTPQDYNAQYNATSLQAKASTVKFELKHEFGLTIEAKGVQNAAVSNTDGTGGRDYVVTYTNKDGKPADAGTKVLVAIPKVGGNVSVLNANGTPATSKGSDSSNKYFEVSIGKEGKATFTVTSPNANDYVSPVVFIDNGLAAGAGVLDKNDLQATGTITYFVNEVTYAAQLKALDADGNPVKSVVANDTDIAYIKYVLVDQNGKVRKADKNTTVSFEFKVGTGSIKVGNTTYQSGTTKTVDASIATGSSETEIQVKGLEPSSITVTATGSKAGIVLPSTDPTSVTVAFTAYADVELATGPVSAIDAAKKELTITEAGKTYTYSYATGTYKVNGQVVSIDGFEAKLVGSDVSVTKDADGKFTFNIIKTGTAVPAAPTKPVVTAATYKGGSAVTYTVPTGVTAYLAPAGTTNFVANGTTITSAVAGDTSITAPTVDGQYKLFLVDAYGQVAVSADSITVDSTAPTSTITGATYDAATDTLVLTGTKFTTAAASGDIKGQLDWDKIVWDINGDGATTADVTFAAADITSATVTNDTTLTIVLTSTKATALEGTTDYGATGGADKLNVTAGFISDAVGNVATTDALVSGTITIAAP